MLTHKQRIMTALRGEMPDKLPYVPRTDLWYIANSAAGTLPEKYRDCSQNEISRAEGWALHHQFGDNLLAGNKLEDEYFHRSLGIMRRRDSVVDFVMPPDVEIKRHCVDDLVTVEYHTPLGKASATFRYNRQMQLNGISIPVIEDHIIESPEDYPAVGYLFENMDVVPNFDRFVRWRDEELCGDGVPVITGFAGGSPMQQIQRDLLDATQFYFHYKDHEKQLRKLAEQMEHLFDRILQISVESPAEVVMWGANFDDMLTYPPYFEKDIMPWIRKAAATLGAAGKRVLCHTDGENFGLMDLIRDSGMHIAESICPYPMTKVKLDGYYRRWSGHLTLFGGIPSTVVMEEETSDEDFEAFLDSLFKAVAPGKNMVVGIADQVPPAAKFERLIRIGERIDQEGRLPLEAGSFNPPAPEKISQTAAPEVSAQITEDAFAQIRQDVTEGDDEIIKEHVQQLLNHGYAAQDILDHGLIAAMDTIGKQFGAGLLFIPEVLLSSRAMTEAIDVLTPYLANEQEEGKGKVLIGTVWGDMHNIGKNMVAAMLKGVGYEVKDLGINVSLEEFLQAVDEFQPDIVALSALLTTTMQEMKTVIAALRSSNLRNRVKIMIGGAPVSEHFAQTIGADGYANDAVEAIAVANRLLQ